ncbi:MAG: hypothetical protein QMD32_02100 [Smithellaceae bacterium]|nr:hypothetical protein [Smithellaceae bacterium]
MTHRDKGRFAAKHPSEKKANPNIARLIDKYAKEGKITCNQSFMIAEELKIPPAAVGMAIDMMEVSITHCQLGLFGYSPERRTIKPVESPAPALVVAIRCAREISAVSCAALWEIASANSVSKMEAAGTCEALGIKIRPCQLGAF